MSGFDSILVPHDGSAEAAKALGCGTWLAGELDATLHILAPAELAIATEHGSRVVLHHAAREPQVAVLDEIASQRVKLVVMTARGESASGGIERARRLGRIAQAVIERSAVPVVLLPLRYKEALPWRSILAAASGERAADRALEAAVALANALRLSVSVVHCAEHGTAAALGSYADAPHHELPGRLIEMVDRGLGEQRSIQEVLVCRGDPAAELLRMMEERPASVLALGWHGTLARSRAPVLKRLLEEACCPLLLVRCSEHIGVRLRIGGDVDAHG